MGFSAIQDTLNLSLLIVMLLFYGAYITKFLWLKKEGIVVNSLAKKNKSLGMRLFELTLTVVSNGMVILQCLSLFHCLPIVETAAYIPIIGFILALLGCLFFIMAAIAMKDSWRVGIDASQKTTLRTNGILRYSRNPAYMGFDLFYIGTALMVPNILLFVFVVFALVIFHFQILAEEKYLSATFGSDYFLYRQKVRRYL